MFKRTRLRCIAFFRRWRRRHMVRPLLELLPQVDPRAPWLARVNWLLDLLDWLHHEPEGARLSPAARDARRTRRLRHLLDAIEVSALRRRAVAESLQAVLGEADALEVFCATGLPREPALVAEFLATLAGKLLPVTPLNRSLDNFIGVLFPRPELAAWIERLPVALVRRVADLCVSPALAARFRGDAEDALTYLATVATAAGLNPEVRARLTLSGVRASPFLRLEGDVADFVAAAPRLRAGHAAQVRAALLEAHAAIVDAYGHLARHGVSLAIVYRLTRLRAILRRIEALVDLLCAGPAEGDAAAGFVADLVRGRHQRTSLRALWRRNTALLSRKMVEHNALHGEHYIARSRSEYAAMFAAAGGGGAITAFTVWFKFMLAGAFKARFLEGLAAAFNYSASFVAMQMAGFVLATKQPAMTAPALAHTLRGLGRPGGMRALIDEVRHLTRSQSAAVLGNVLAVVPTVLVLCLLLQGSGGHAMLEPEKARHVVESFSILGATPLFAAFTGVLLWLSSLGAGLAVNWFALRRVRDGIAWSRGLQAIVGEARAARVAHACERHIGALASNVSLGLLLGLLPVCLEFVGLPIEVRHVTLSTGSLTAAVFTLGTGVMATPGFWLAVTGIASMAVLNVGVAFTLAFLMALRASGTEGVARGHVWRVMRRHLWRAPMGFLFPLAPHGSRAPGGRVSLAR